MSAAGKQDKGTKGLWDNAATKPQQRQRENRIKGLKVYGIMPQLNRNSGSGTMNFNLKSTAQYKAIKVQRNPLFRFNRFFRILFFSLALLFLLFFIFGVFFDGFSQKILKQMFGAVIFSLSLGFFFAELNLFFNSKIKKPELKHSITEFLSAPHNFNSASFLTMEAARVCCKALQSAKRNRLKEPAKELLLFHLFCSKINQINFVFGRAGIDPVQIRNNLKAKIKKLKQSRQWTSGFYSIILEAGKIAHSRNKPRITSGHLLTALAKDEPFSKILTLNNLRDKDIENLVCWHQRIEEKLEEHKKFWTYHNLMKRGSIAKDWAAGYSINLDRYAVDLRDLIIKAGFQEIVGHQREITFVERVLEKEEINNVLLVGEPGTGRQSIIRAIAQRAFLGESSPSINYKRILDFDIGQVSAETQSDQEFEAVLEQCFQQTVQAGNIILNIKGIENYLAEDSGQGPGKVDISGILARYLPLKSFQITAITSFRGLHNILEQKPALLNLFEKVEVSEISEDETFEFLENVLPFFEKKHKIFISYKAVREILRLSARYLEDTAFPEKALRLLDEAVSWLKVFTKQSILLPQHIRKVISEKVEIPLEELEEKEKEKLLNLEELIHQRIINQDQAVKQVSSALRRARSEIQMRQGPIGSFLFLGPTGVGKTETSKALAQIYFGSEQRTIRLDMSEFQAVADIKRLIGASKGEIGLLTTAVREAPFSLILLDELEKAHPNILNLFLQVLDEGWLTDGFGRRVDFKNTIIIATSNAGAEVIRQDIRENKQMDMVKDDLLDYLLKERVFRPEFINRFDAVVVFRPLTKENLLAICQLMLKQLVDNLKNKGIEFDITRQLKEKIVEISYSPEFGAREMRRMIQDKVENILAEAILSGRIKRGDRISIKVEAGNFLIDKQV